MGPYRTSRYLRAPVGVVFRLVTLTAWQCVPHLDVTPVPPFQRRLHPVVRFLQHIEQERSESMTRPSGQRRAKCEQPW